MLGLLFGLLLFRWSGQMPMSQLMNLAGWVFSWYIFFLFVIPFLFFLCSFFERLFIFILLLRAFISFTIFFSFRFLWFLLFLFACGSLWGKLYWWKNYGRAWFRKTLTGCRYPSRCEKVYNFLAVAVYIPLAVIMFLLRAGLGLA